MYKVVVYFDWLLIVCLVALGSLSGDKPSSESSIQESSEVVDLEEAMPITDANFQEYEQKITEAAQNIEPSVGKIDRMIEVAKKPLEDMGYDFDATLLSTIKNLKSIQDMSQVTQALIAMKNTYEPVFFAVQENPDEAVSKGLVTNDTKEKILLYLQYGDFDNKNITKALKILDTIKQCQNENTGVCSGRQLFDAALANGGFKDSGMNATADEGDNMISTHLEAYLSDLRNNIDILRDSNGNLLGHGDRIDLETSFKVEVSDVETLKNTLKNLWWLK